MFKFKVEDRCIMNECEMFSAKVSHGFCQIVINYDVSVSESGLRIGGGGIVNNNSEVEYKANNELMGHKD
jgi:hypothetical protein